MPGINLNQPLLGAGAAAKNDWAAASARTALDFTAQAEFKRGFNLAIGLSALAQADAGLAQFVAATVRGNAFAEAEASLQVQFPLNLFQSFGLAVGAQAKAQAAAGIEVGLSLVVGDFVELIERDADMVGIPLELVLLLLEEVDIGGKFEIHVAASAMAYASLQITGTVIDRSGQPAGFQYFVDAGLGLAAGMGFSGGLKLGFKDFRHFYGRAVDLTVDAVVRDLTDLLADDTPDVRALAGALGPVAKVALRIAYELGDFIAKNNPGNSSAAAQSLANHCVGILLEESQRFILERFVEAGLGTAHEVIAGLGSGLSQSAWDALLPQRRSLANRLYAVPPDPFQPTDTNRAYWHGVQTELLALADALPAGARDAVRLGAAAAGAAAELLLEMFRARINNAQAYVVAVGVGQITTKPSFGGPLPAPLPAGIRAVINAAFGRAAGAGVDFGDLTGFLALPQMLEGIRAGFPGVNRFAQVFAGPVAADAVGVLAALLSNREAFLADANGDINPRHTLAALLDALDSFITQQLNAELRARVYAATPDETTRLYFDEVLLSAITFTKDVAFRTVLDWEQAPVAKDVFTEALASVLTMLAGRSVVIIGDQFFDVIAQSMQSATGHAAAHVEGPRSVFRAIGLQPGRELSRLFADTLRIGGEVFGPLPDETRARIRRLLYEIMEPLPPGGGQDFLAELGDQFFIPNGEHVDALRDELLAISRDRFGAFVEKVLLSAGAMLLEAIAEFIAEVIATVKKWEKDIRRAIAALGDALQDLADEIARLIGEMEAAFGRAVHSFEALLEYLASSSMRSALKSQIVDDLYARGKGVLRQNPVYQALPSGLRRDARSLLKDTIRGLVNNPIVDPVLDAVGDIAGAIDEVVDDVQSLDPTRPLSGQVLELVMGRVEEHLRGFFGSTRPRIGIGFEFSYEFFGHHTVRFELGRVEIPFSTFFRLIRDAVDRVDAVDAALTQVAADLAEAFGKQFDLDAKVAEQEAKTRQRERLARIDGEHSASPKEIAVLSPAPGSVHGGDVRFAVHLGGVPASYLGLDADEQQRVFILVNGELISPKSLIVGAAAAAADPALHTLDLPLDRMQGFDAHTGEFRNQGVTIRLSGAVPAASPKPKALARPAGPGFQRRVAAGKGAAHKTTTTTTQVLPGRILPPSRVREMAAALTPGTSIAFTLEAKDLVQGANALAVVLIDRGGRRYEQVVAFGVAAPPRPPRRGSVITMLPVRGKSGAGKSPQRPAPFVPPVGAGLTASAMQGRVAKASDYLHSQARLNLAQFRGRRR